MANSTLKQTFQATIASSLDGLHSLVPLLEEERSALKNADDNVIKAISQRKLEKLIELEHSVLAREHLQQQAGFESGLAGGRAFVESLFTQHEIEVQWRELENLSEAVHLLNTENAKLASARHKKAS